MVESPRGPRSTATHRGPVRGSPYGAMHRDAPGIIRGATGSGSGARPGKGGMGTPIDAPGSSLGAWPYPQYPQDPIEGFDHIYGPDLYDEGGEGEGGGGVRSGAGVAHKDMADSLAAHKKAAALLHMGVKMEGAGAGGEVKFGGGGGGSQTTAAISPKEEEGTDDGMPPVDAPIKSLRDKYRLLPHFLSLRGLMSQHIASYDYFITRDISDIVASPSAREIRSDHDPKFYLRYTRIWVGEPSVEEDAYSSTTASPAQCRLRDCTYSAPIYVDVRYTRGRQIVKKTKVPIGRMPIMLRSARCMLRGKNEKELADMGECPYDPGGYFIVRGAEKVILMQEQLGKNRYVIEKDPKGNVQASVTTSTHERKSKCYIYNKKGKVYLKHNTLGEDTPILIVLRAMGLECDMEAVAMVAGNDPDLVEAVALCLEEPAKLGIVTQRQSLKYIGNRIRGKAEKLGAARPEDRKYNRRQPTKPEDEAREVLANVVLSHVPVVNFDFREKCIYIAHIVRRVLLVSMGRESLDDKDYYGNKRLETAGNLLSLLFEDLFKRFSNDLKMQADKILSKPNRAQAFDVIKLVRTDTITMGMNTAISTGNWIIKRFRMERAGVTQVLSRLSYISALGMVTRVNSQFEKTRKVSGPRSLQPSQWGMLCPADTPEGEACGLVKNLALLSHITTDEEIGPVARLCLDLGVEDVRSADIYAPGTHLVLLNGNILGAHCRPQRFVRQFRSMRRQGMAGEFVSVYLHKQQKAIHIASDGGRVCRPLIIVDGKTGRPKLKQIHLETLAMGVLGIKDLLKQNIVEYIDVNEENNCLIAVTERDLEEGLRARKEGTQKMAHTHLEIDPMTLLGVVAGLIPFPHHNQSPRNTYQSAMGKQAMGCTGMNQYARMDGLIYSLVYPMKPMVKTRTLDLINFDNVPGGQNACIAVMAYSGYDIEDAIVLNKASIDRGFGRCLVLRKHQTSVRRYANGATDRTVGAPDPNDFLGGEDDPRYSRYRAIDRDGICMVGEKLDDRVIMVNKESPTNLASTVGDFGMSDGAGAMPVNYKSTPLTYKGTVPVYVDKVLITSNESEHFLIKVMVHQVRRPEVGDKFSSRHGQKGVCGLIGDQVAMPFSEKGLPPDLIMNPHGFPSRMTVGKLLELLVGKAGVYEGRQAYGSAFGEELGSADTAAAASEALIRNGLNYTGKDVMYSGVSGEPLDAYIFSGPVFYQKLKHMVLDKMHARARGPRAVLTRQPTEGRSRDGGLRLGEMERDCLIAYGASSLIMERLMHSSDAFSANVCTTCGLLQYQNWCQYCRSGERVTDIRLPYACNLLFQELQAMNVMPRLRLKDC